jgi:hypothetical protein
LQTSVALLASRLLLDGRGGDIARRVLLPLWRIGQFWFACFGIQLGRRIFAAQNSRDQVSRWSRSIGPNSSSVCSARGHRFNYTLHFPDLNTATFGSWQPLR